MSHSAANSPEARSLRQGKITFVPSFKPPPPSQFHNLSHHDRLGLLLSLQDSQEKEKSDVTASRIQEGIKTLPVTAAKNMPHDPANTTASKAEASVGFGGISLFGGAVVHKKSAPGKGMLNSSFAGEQPKQKRPREGDHLDSSGDSAPPMHPFFSTHSPPTKNPVQMEARKDPSPQPAPTKRANLKGAAGSSSRERGGDRGVGVYTVGDSDFQGITNFCCNAGGRNEGLRYLVERCGRESTLSITIICADDHLSSNLDNTTIKYCTPSMRCKGCSWACDRGPRMGKAAGPMLGAVILVVNESTGEEECFFLPLMECVSGKTINVECIGICVRI
jgi:hypothetical protein